MVSPDEADGNRGEPEARGAVVELPLVETERLTRTSQAGEDAADGHCQRDRQSPGESGVGGGAAAKANRAHLVAEGRLEDDVPEDDGGDDGYDDAGMQTQIV